MDLVAQHLDNNAHSEFEIQNIKHKIALRKRYLRQFANESDEVIIAINEMTDISLLNALNQKCNEMQKMLDNERTQEYMLLNIESIQNAHTTLSKIRKFDECEMDLLHTLQTTNFNRNYDSYYSHYTINFILNCEKYKYAISDSRTARLTNCEKHKHKNDKLQHSAFMAKMTIDEYNRFVANLVLIILNRYNVLYYSQHSNGLNCQTVNIADLLLCSINEQYDKNVSYANMSKADLVFYDEYLLKRITSIKFVTRVLQKN